MYLFDDIELFIFYDQSIVINLQPAKEKATAHQLEHVNVIVTIMEVIVQVSCNIPRPNKFE